MIDFVFFPKSGRIQQSILLTCAVVFERIHVCI